FCNAALEHFQEAFDDLTEAIQCQPNSPYTHFDRGRLCASIGEIELALSDFKVALQLKREIPGVYLERAEVYLRQGKFDEALADTGQALQYTNDVQAITIRSRVYFLMDKPEAGVREWTEYIQQNLESVSAYFGRGRLLLAMKNYQAAASDFTRLLSLK